MNNNYDNEEIIEFQRNKFEDAFNRIVTQEPNESQPPKLNHSKFSNSNNLNGDTLYSIVSNIKIEKQTAGRTQKKKKVQWNDKNTKMFIQYFQQFSGNLEMITREFQKSNVLGQTVDIKQIRNKYKIEKKKDTLTLSKYSQKIKKENNNN